ncbi:MAG: osmoprotectant transport system permease protein [Solirubrobacteraceae bacterium]|jgi:osmoprotectant transport system permease protein|nr:osmoprotectant transport system permease protein [Solirubrobacteraceae bacterium]
MIPFAQSAPVIPNFGGGGDCVRQNRTFCWNWFQDHWGDTFQPALVQHVKLTAIAVGIGFAIAMVASLIAHRRGWFETPFTLVAGILYTIPSLALFQLLVPITGLTVTTAEIALVSYTLLILFRNILTGLRGVPPDVREAARGMGLSSRQILWRVELPLALPAIVAGLRVAVVTVISLATVAAFVVDEGLGAPIFQSIAAPFNTAFIAAGGLAVLLALVADALLVGGQRLLTPWAARRA